MTSALSGRAHAEPVLVAAVVTFAAALGLAALARRLGLEDEGGGHGLHREPRGEPKALVGGLALAAGLALWQSLESADFALRPLQLVPLALALAIGLCDDRSRAGLGARTKLVLQCLPAAAFAATLSTSVPWEGLALAVLAAVAAQNLANTWDNADGVLLGTGCAAFALARPEWSLLLGAVLVCNLRARGSARVLLGDSGSHLIAILLLLEPRALGAFVLPALDLARVVAVRRRAGRPWWRGDRAHLAHRLQARGLAPPAVAALLVLAALPALVLFALPDAAGPARWLGVAGTGLLFLLLVRWTPAVDGRGVSLPGTRSGSRP